MRNVFFVLRKCVLECFKSYFLVLENNVVVYVIPAITAKKIVPLYP